MCVSLAMNVEILNLWLLGKFFEIFVFKFHDFSFSNFNFDTSVRSRSEMTSR